MLESRIRPRCQTYMKALFLNRPGSVRPIDHIQRAAERHGLTDLAILKTRKDKIIARAVHHEWGRVALKVTDPVLNSVQAHSGYHTDGLVAATPAPFLPAIHAFGLGYSVSEWIDGPHVHDLDRNSCEALQVTDFVDNLQAWCSRRPEQKVLETTAILSIVRFYVETTVRRMRYRSAANCLRACVRFRGDEKRLGGYVDEMVRLAPSLALKETPMFGDVQVWNVMVSQTDHRLVLVDFEALRPGNSLFDVVFWLASLMIHRLPRPLLDRLAHHIFSPDLMPSGDCIRFFCSFATYVTETYMTIDGHGWREIEPNLEVLRGAAEQSG
jgi:hypothetical protein